MNDFLRSDLVLSRFLCSLKDYAIVILDKGGNVANWNVGAKALKGYSHAEVLGKHFSIFYTSEAKSAGRPDCDLMTAETIGRHEEEGWRVRKDGSQFWAHVLITPLYDEDNNLIGFGKVLRDFTGRKYTTEQSANMLKLLEFAARTDYLTGLENRRSLDRVLTSTLSATRRHGRAASLAVIDLDHFKAFNDEFGHQAGDGYLKQAAKCWREVLRPEDFIARYGGEEFVVILPDTEIAGASAVMERLCACTPTPLTCSIGVAEWDSLEMPDQLIGRADRALYAAKANGRNRVVIASARAKAPSEPQPDIDAEITV